jgi:nitrogen fixation/metabolism regulation signal transduction histidine kinase
VTAEPKSLSVFIRRSLCEIIDEFSAFARTLMPPDFPMTDQDLRDHYQELLLAIAEDLDTAQT